MASASKIQLDTSVHPVFYTVLKEDTARKTSELLQRNHDEHHIFFNVQGFHNHIAHHLLSLYALGATPAQVQNGFDINASYQRKPILPGENPDLRDPATWQRCLHDERYFRDFLLHFQDEMSAKGWRAVLNEQLFAGDARAEDMLVRLYAGFLHPIIHLGFGMEFEQPAIMAEALAQAACHDRWIGDLLLNAEQETRKRGVARMDKSIVQLLEEIRANEKLKMSPHWDDNNKIRDGIMVRAPQEMLDIVTQVVVREEELEARIAEMMNATIFYTAASQHPPKSVKIDFYFMHCVNASIFFPTFLGPSSPFPAAAKIRLLEWKIRLDLTMYASRRAPALLAREIVGYRPKQPGGWQSLFDRIDGYSDDGHASKMLRTVAAAEKICPKYEGKVDMRVKGDMFLQIGHMLVDSVERYGVVEDEPRWARSVGFDEAWEKIGDRPMAVL